MAADQPLGTLPIIITGDWTELQDAINEAVAAAQAGGQQVAAAFASIGNSDAEQGIEQIGQAAADTSQQLSLFADSASSVSDAATEITGSTQDASAGITSIGDSASDAAGGAGELGSALGDASDAISSAGDEAVDAEGSLATLADTAQDVGDAGDEAAGGVSNLGDAAVSAGDDAEAAVGGVQAFTGAEQEAGSGGETASTGVGAFRASLLELAEGLSVIETVKELGEGVIEAYASIQTATVALTSLTGSANTANSMIAEMEETALQIPVSLEGMVSAAQRMTAFGLSTEQVDMALQDAANAAAATGNSFDAVAQRITVMSASGMAGARQLATLGLSSQNLADAMNAIVVGSDTTAAGVTKAFKAIGDQSTQLEVLDYALQKFGGDAQAQAQTIAGAWQILKNQWSETLEEVGADLAPLVTNLLSFASTVVSVGREAADAFASWPAPLKDVAEIATVVFAGGGILLTGLAGVSLAVMGLASVPEVLSKLASNIALLGSAAGVSTPEVTEFAASETAAGTAALAAGPEVAGLAAAIEAAGIQTTAAITGLTGIAGGAEAAGGAAAEAAGSAGVGGFIEALGSLVTEASLASAGVVALGVTLTAAVWYEAKTDLDNVTASMDAMQTAMANGQGATAAQAAQIKLLTAEINSYNASAKASAQIPLPNFDPTTESIAQYIAALQKAVTGTGAFSFSLTESSSQAAATSKTVTDLTASVQKHEAAVQGDKDAITQFTAQLAQATPGTAAATNAADLLAAAHVKLAADTKTLETELGSAQTKTESYAQAMKDAAIAGPPTFAQAVADAEGKIEGNLNDQAAKLQIAMGVWVDLATSGTASAQQISTAAQTVATDAQKIGLSAQDTEALWDAALSRMGSSTDDFISGWEDAASKFGAGSSQAQAAMNQLAFVFGGDVTAMQAAIQAFVGDEAGFVTAMVNGKQVIVEQATAAEGLTAATQATAQAVTTLTQVDIDGQTHWVSLTGVLDDAATATEDLGEKSTGTYTIIRGGAAPVQAAVGDLSNLAAAHLSAAEKAQQLAEATGTANGVLIGFGPNVTNAAQAMAAAAAQAAMLYTGTNSAMSAVVNLDNQISALANTFAQTGDPAIEAQIDLLNQEAEAAFNAADGVTALSNAQSKTKGAGGSGGGGGGSLNAEALQYLYQYTSAAALPFVVGSLPGMGGNANGPGFFGGGSGFNASTGGTSAPSGGLPNSEYGGLSTGGLPSWMSQTATGTGSPAAASQYAEGASLTAGATALQQLQDAGAKAASSLDLTTTSVGNLDYALEGGSLRPSLDLATASTKALDTQLTTANASTATLSTSVSNLIKSLTAPTALGPSSGDPLSEAQIAMLAAGQTLSNSLNLTAQQMVYVNQDVQAYTASMGAYSAAEGSYQQGVNELNSAQAILGTTTGVTTANLGTGTVATTDLGNAIVSLAGVQGSTATSASDLQGEIGSLSSQLQQTTADATATTGSYASANDASNALQAGMGELGDELAAVQAGGTAAQGAAEYLATAFGSNTSGLTAAMNANSLITGSTTDSTTALTGAVTSLGTAATTAGSAITSASNAISTAATNLNETNANGVQSPYLATTAATSTPPAPTGLQAGTYATIQDAVNAGLNPNELGGSAATGYFEQPSEASSPVDTGQAASIAANTAATTPGGSPGNYATIQDYTNAGLNPNEMEGNAQSGYWQAAAFGGASLADIAPAWQAGSIADSAYNLPSGVTGIPSAGTVLNLNISGMTPGASQQVAGTMVTALRNAGMKIT